MQENYIKEIDFLDLIIEWLEHWRSLLIAIVIGILASLGVFFIYSNDEIPNSSLIEEQSIEDLSKTDSLSTLTPKKLSEVSIDDMEKYFLSETDINVVDELVQLYYEYLENIKEYESQKEDLELKDRAEAFNYIVNTKHIIETRRNSLTPDQQIYYCEKLGLNTVVGELDLDEDNATDLVEISSTRWLNKKTVIIIILAAIFHFIIVSSSYILDKKIKRKDGLSKIAKIPEYTRMIDWDKISKKKGLDKFISNMRYSSVRYTSFSDAIEINAKATIEKLKNKSYNSIAVVGLGMEEERGAFINQISKVDSSVVVKSIDSITHSVNGSDDIAGVNAAVLAVKVGFTKYNDFFEELQSLRDRDVDVIGIAVFE